MYRVIKASWRDSVAASLLCRTRSLHSSICVTHPLPPAVGAGFTIRVPCRSFRTTSRIDHDPLEWDPETELDRQFEAAFDRQLACEQAAARVVTGPAGPPPRPEEVERKKKEAYYGFKAAHGWTGNDLWRRGWATRAWATDYMDEELRRRQGTPMHKAFRAEFRIPLEMFDALVDELRAAGLDWARDERIPRCGAPPIPLQLKVMSALRVMAIGVPFSAFVHQGLSRDVVRTFFLEFVKWMATTVYAREVRIPNAEELKHHADVFARSGFTGASLPLTTCTADCFLPTPALSPPQALISYTTPPLFGLCCRLRPLPRRRAPGVGQVPIF